MKSILISLFVLFPLAALPQQTDGQSANVTKIVRIKYGIAQKIADLVGPGSHVIINADNYSNVIVLKGNSKDVFSAEQTIHELDFPAVAQTAKNKDIELIVSVIGGVNKAQSLSGEQIPEAMTPVVKQLRAAFPYQSYQLLNSVLLRSSEGTKAQSRGNIAGFDNHSRPNEYLVEYNKANVSNEDGKPAIHLQTFQFQTNVAITTSTTQYQTVPVSIVTDVDLREGQKVVVGKANVGSSDLALFVVLTARLVD